MIVRRQVSPSIVSEALLYKENSADILSIVEIQLVSGTEGFIIFKNTDRLTIQLLNLKFIGGGNV